MPKMRSPNYPATGLNEAITLAQQLWKKEERQNVRLHGTKCSECGTVQYPSTRVCIRCRNSEGLREIPLGRTGRGHPGSL